MSSKRIWGPAVRFGAAGVVLGVALSWAIGAFPNATRARAAAEPPAANGTIAFTSGGPGPGQWLYVIDTKVQALAVYQVNPQDPKGAIKLQAARQYRWDLKLAEYNNQPPEVATIESMVAAPKR